MTWDITLLTIHICAAMGFAMMFCTAPDALQKLVLGLLMTAALVLVYVYAASAVDRPLHWSWRRIALEVEHIGVLLYLFRLLFVEKIKCKNLQRRSPQSPA